MITSELRDGIVWMAVEGELSGEDFKREAARWLAQGEPFSGFISDFREMTTIPSTAEQQELEEWRKQNKSGKPHAMLGRTNALGVLIQIFIRLTKANDTRYFMDPDAAVAWVKGFGSPPGSD
jgi:hypothetical protein